MIRWQRLLRKRFHIVFLRDDNGTSKKISFRGPVAFMLGFVVLFILVSNLFFFKFFIENQVLSMRLSHSDKVVQEQKEQLLSFTNKLKTMEQDLNRVRDFDSKLRVMLNLDQNRGIEVTALGGAETKDFAEGYLPIYRQELLARKMHSFLEQLRTDTRMEEVHQQALLQALNERRDLLASTPSIWPAKGWITSSFGVRTSPFTAKREFHKGLDISAPMGSPIYAPANGKVLFVGDDSGYGLTVALNHGNGMSTRFAHLNSSAVKAGQNVSRGELIAFVGSSGRSTGPHLHYEVRLNGVFVNPERFILD